MGESCTATLVPSQKIDGSLPQLRKFASGTCLFGECAKVAWEKPDTAVAILADVSDRAARDYISGKVAVPSIVLAALFHEMAKRPD